MASLEKFSPLLRDQPSSETTDTAVEVVGDVSEPLSWAITTIYIAGIFIAVSILIRGVRELMRKR